MKKVVKFGGSSLASAKQFKKVGDIIRADKSRRYVVPSAPGKRNKNDTKVTDMLYACYEAASTGASYGKLLSAIKERYEQIIDGLELNLNLDYEFKTIEENFIAKKGSDYAASRGEYLNGIIMSHYLGYEFIDAAEVIFFDENGTFLSEKTNEELSERLAHTERAVIPGFYGSNPDGTIHTFSRGGSDITGSIVARAIHADLYENWTDVSGFLVTTRASWKIRFRSRPSPTKNCVNWLTWVPASFMRMPSSRYAARASRSTSATPTSRRIRVHSSSRIPAGSRNTPSPVSPERLVSALLPSRKR